MEVNDVKIRMADTSSPDDIRQIVAIAEQWPAQFVPAAVDAIRQDLDRFPCFILTRGSVIEAFVVCIPASLELELLWGAARRSSFRRTQYMEQLIRSAESKYFSSSPSCLLAYAKMSAPDAAIPGDTAFRGDASLVMRRLLTKLGYVAEYRLDSYWKPQDHCVLLVKRKDTAL